MGLFPSCQKEGKVVDDPIEDTAQIPQVTTSQISSISDSSAVGGGNVTSNGGAGITARGVCWSTHPMPDGEDTKTGNGTGTGHFISNLTMLLPETTYYVRAYATNRAGTGYGAEVSFTTSAESVVVTDVDGNIYHAVTIGSQVWLRENLKVTHYRNGDTIAGAVRMFGDDPGRAVVYGRLYSWNAVKDMRKLAPEGFHIPTDIEWQQLVDYLGGQDVAGGKLKMNGYAYWAVPNSEASNSSGFTALPGGYLAKSGNRDEFLSLGTNAYFWTSTYRDNTYAWHRMLSCYYANIYRTVSTRAYYYSVRLIKDNPVPSLEPMVSSVSVPATVDYFYATLTVMAPFEGSPEFEYGLCWSEHPNPTVADFSMKSGNPYDAFTYTLTQLKDGTTYYVRSYASNGTRLDYGNEISFTTKAYCVQTPAVSTSAATGITYMSAITGGSVSDDYDCPVSAHGVCWSTQPNPTLEDHVVPLGPGTGSFSYTLSGLAENTVYYVRAFATSQAGTGYGTIRSFTTNIYCSTGPAVQTSSPTSVLYNSATCSGTASNDYQCPISMRGMCWGTQPNPTVSDNVVASGSGTGSFSCTLSGLAENTLYYVRAFATSQAGTGYGVGRSFRTRASTVTDIDGNVYHTVLIANRLWLMENLRVTRYVNGDAIPRVEDPSQWVSTTSGAYCIYNNDAANLPVYGLLYNDYAVHDTRKLVPDGFHVPSSSEWSSLISALGGQNVAGGKLKEMGLTHWLSPNVGATNEVGFNGLPGGFRTGSNQYYPNPPAFVELGSLASFWSYSGMAYFLNTINTVAFGVTYDRRTGCGVRCVADDNIPQD